MWSDVVGGLLHLAFAPGVFSKFLRTVAWISTPFLFMTE